jgi:hypothetical protein
MRALALEHLHSNPIGVYGDVLREQTIDVDRIRLDRGDTTKSLLIGLNWLHMRA